MVLADPVVPGSFPVQFHLYLTYLFSCESCVAFQLRDVLVLSSDLVVQVAVSLLTVVFLCLYNQGQDFQVIIIALVGDLYSCDFGVPFRSLG